MKFFRCDFFPSAFFWSFALPPKQETPGNLSREDWVVVCAASDDSDALVNGEKAGRIAVREAANDKLPLEISRKSWSRGKITYPK